MCANDSDSDRSNSGIERRECAVRAHLAGDGKVFCSLRVDGDSFHVLDLESLESKMAAAEREVFGELVLESALTPEPERDTEAPTVGTAVWTPDGWASAEFDFSEVEYAE